MPDLDMMSGGGKSIGQEMADAMEKPEKESEDNGPSSEEKLMEGGKEALEHGTKAAAAGAEAYTTGNPLKALEAAKEAKAGLEGAQKAADGLGDMAEEADEKADSGMDMDPSMALTMGG